MHPTIVSEFVQFSAALFAVSNVFGVVPLFIAMTSDRDVHERKIIASTAVVTFAVTLIVFCLLGDLILRFFGLSFADFRIAGGTILTISGLQMVGAIATPPANSDMGHPTPVVLGLFPLGIPQLAGPGSMSTVILFTHHESDLSVAALDAIAITVIVLMSAGFWLLFRAAAVYGALLGPAITAMLIRVMGLILASIGVQFVLTGIIDRFQIVVQ